MQKANVVSNKQIEVKNLDVTEWFKKYLTRDHPRKNEVKHGEN